MILTQAALAATIMLDMAARILVKSYRDEVNEAIRIHRNICGRLPAGRPSRDVIVAGRQALTAEWWSSCRDRFDVYVSALVVTESEDGDPEAVRRRMAIVQDIPAVNITDEARGLAQQLVETGLVPAKCPEDALHITICATNGIDYLATWNCTHLANATIRRRVESFLDEMGCGCPVICTPEELVEM